MDIAFQSRALRDICESETLLKAKFGARLGSTIMRRLADLRAAATIYELPLGKPRVFGAKSVLASVDLAMDRRLFVRANHLKLPLGEGGSVDWTLVSRIKIVRIESDG